MAEARQDPAEASWQILGPECVLRLFVRNRARMDPRYEQCLRDARLHHGPLRWPPPEGNDGRTGTESVDAES